MGEHVVKLVDKFTIALGFESLTVVTMKSIVFCVVNSCSLVEAYRHFGEMYCMK